MIKKLTIHYFSKSVFNEVEALPSGILARYLYLIQRMQDTGSANLGFPHTEKIDDDIFEIRAKSKEGIGRVFYCTMKSNQIWVLHSFVKKTQKIPRKELDIANERLRELKNER